MGARVNPTLSWTVAVGLALLVTTTGCTQALKAGLATAGATRDQPTKPLGHGRAESGKQSTSTYQHAPTLDFWTAAVDQPYSVASSLSNSMRGQSLTGPVNCQVFPLGLARVLPIDASVTGTPLHDFRGIHLGIAGNLASSRTLVAGDRLGFAKQALSASSRTGTASNQCGQSIFLYLQLGPGSGTPVSVLR